MQKTCAGKTLDEEIARLILLHGKSEFREAAERLSKGKAGPKTIDDWPTLRGVLDQDARDWLDGKKLVSTQALMVGIAEKLDPEHTGYDRIYRKLLEGRTRVFLGRAYKISESEYPVRRHLDAIDPVPQNVSGLNGRNLAKSKLL